MKKYLLAFWSFFFCIFTSIAIYAENSPKPYIDSANKKEQSGDYAGAIKDYNKAINFDPGNPEVYFYRAKAKPNIEDDIGVIQDCEP